MLLAINFLSNDVQTAFYVSLAMLVVILTLYIGLYFVQKKKVKNKKENVEVEALTEADVVDAEEQEECQEAEAESEPQEETSSVEVEEKPAPEEETSPVEVEEKPASEEEILIDTPEVESEVNVDVKNKKRVYKGKFELFPSGDGYAYQLKASNGETMIVSEVYASRDGAIKSIDNVKKNLESGEVEVFEDKRGNYRFKLLSKNHRILALSANYSNEKSASSASKSFAKFAMNADIVDVIYEDTDFVNASIIEINSEPKAGGKYFIEKYQGVFYWVLKANNGQILCQSNGYTSKSSCTAGIAKFKTNVEKGVFKCVKDKNDQYSYKLYSQAGRLCAVGESCKTQAAAQRQANSVYSFYKNDDIVEVK